MSSGEHRWTFLHFQAILANMQCTQPFRYTHHMAVESCQRRFANNSEDRDSHDKHCHDPIKARRIGEADNPGPSQRRKKCRNVQAVVAIINPTAIRNRQDEFQQLIDSNHVNTFCCSETTATSDVVTMTHKFNQLKLSTVWSQPVQTQREKVSNQPSLRGRAGGTSIHSKWPIREGMSDHEHPKAPDRITHAVLQWGGTFHSNHNPIWIHRWQFLA